jgi:hypothetical protein
LKNSKDEESALFRDLGAMQISPYRAIFTSGMGSEMPWREDDHQATVVDDDGDAAG